MVPSENLRASGILSTNVLLSTVEFTEYANICAFQGRIQDLIKGGAPDRDRPKLPTVRSSIM